MALTNAEMESACLAPAFIMPSLERPGRGATINPASRFDPSRTEAFDDGWVTLGLEDLPQLPTTLIEDHAKSALSYNDSPDLSFDRGLNPYRGCEHGCVYCYARPSHAYLGYSPGLDFETRILFKPNLPELLERELRKPGYQARTIALGSNTDPYQPAERTLEITRATLEVLDRYNHPVSIVTKSAGVIRDADILARMAKRNLVRVWLSITTLDRDLSRHMEPRAATPSRRLGAISELARQGIPVGVMAAPMIPGVNDTELEKILETSTRFGASHAAYVLLRLPHEVRDIFTAWLETHLPDRARRVLSLIRDTRNGNLNNSQFGDRFLGTGPYAQMLGQRFAQAVRQNNLNQTPDLDWTQFRPHGDAADLQLMLL
jgi:DNA repair photolyase